jgi:hypothetical protein
VGRMGTDGDRVPGGAECAVDEGAEWVGPAKGGEDLAEQDRYVVLVGAATVQVSVEGGSGAGAPLEMLLQSSPLPPLPTLGLRLGLGLPRGFASDRVVLAAAVGGCDSDGSERARGGAGVVVEMEGKEASGRHCHGCRGSRANTGEAWIISIGGRLCTVRSRNGWPG